MKYQELDIAGLTAMELSALIQPGDMLTIRGPGTSDTAVRIVNEGGRIYSFMATVVIDVDRLTGLAFVKITKVERPIPEVELPIVPGYYESPQFPLDAGWAAYRLLDSGHWFSSGQVTEARMRELMPLTRLVPETESARVEVDAVAGWLDQYKEGIIAYPITAALALADAINNGELDK